MSFVRSNNGIRPTIETVSDVSEIFGVIDSNRANNFVIRKHKDGSISLTKFQWRYSMSRGREIWKVIEHTQIGGNYAE
jgi:hypothetical protein